MDYKDKVVNAEVILPDGYSIGGSGLPSQSFKLYTEDTATIFQVMVKKQHHLKVLLWWQKMKIMLSKLEIMG